MLKACECREMYEFFKEDFLFNFKVYLALTPIHRQPPPRPHGKKTVLFIYLFMYGLFRVCILQAFKNKVATVTHLIFLVI